MKKKVDCFKAYDIRGRVGIELNEDIAYRIGRSVAKSLGGNNIIVGYDARATSPSFARAVADGVTAEGVDVIDIGLAGTEEMYWAVTEFNSSAGIEVTASHNPIEYNGMKIVKACSEPLNNFEFEEIKKLTEDHVFSSNKIRGKVYFKNEEAKEKYVKKLLSFVDLNSLKPMKIVINSGNGAAGPTLDSLEQGLKKRGINCNFIKLQHSPDPTFPNGIPNPMIEEKRQVTRLSVKENSADFGIAFDGDFDRCFFFDNKGEFIPGEYIVGLLAQFFLVTQPGESIVHDCRLIWNIVDSIVNSSGKPIISKTGHAFIKQKMRETEAVYGGEISAHHYFKDFSYCDSGMIPWLLIWQLISISNQTLSQILAERRNHFISSGELNFTVKDADLCLKKVRDHYETNCRSFSQIDGVSFEFENWRFNLRKSNTEPLVRLNIETRGDFKFLLEKRKELEGFVRGM